MPDDNTGSYSLHKQWILTVTCGRCGKSRSFSGKKQPWVLSEAREAGWRIGKHTRCPLCNPRSPRYLPTAPPPPAPPTT